MLTLQFGETGSPLRLKEASLWDVGDGCGQQDAAVMMDKS
jgi:hypothetical protein